MQGSVKKYEGKRGASWYYEIDVGVKPDGKRDQKKQRGFATKRAAEEAMRQELHRRREGTYIEPSKLTVAGFLGQWLEVAAAGLKPATQNSHRTIVDHRIVPHLGAIPLQKLTPLAVQRWVGQLLAQGYAPSTVRLTVTTLRSALAQAVAWGLLPRNPTDKPRQGMGCT